MARCKKYKKATLRYGHHNGGVGEGGDGISVATQTINLEPTYISYKYGWSLKAPKREGREKKNEFLKCLSEIHCEDDL